MLKNSLVFIFCTSALFVSSCAVGNESERKPKFKHIELLDYGSCRNKKEEIDLSEVFYLQNTSLNYFSENTLNKFYLNGQEVIVQKDKSDRKLVFSITDFIEEQYKLVNSDIDLSFVLRNNELLIYWRETFLHRAYRQGIVSIHKDRIVAVCDGIGGIDSSH